MKKIITVIAIVVSSLAYSQRVYILPKMNDTIRFRIVNEKVYTFLIIQDSITKFQKRFTGQKYFDIYCKDYLYSKEVDTINKIVAIFFNKKESYTRQQLLKMYNQEAYYQIRDIINELLDDFQDRDINDYQDDRDIIQADRNRERQQF